MNKLLNKYRTLPISVKATLWFMVCSVLQKAISIVTVPIFTRMLTTSQYGLFSSYNAWLQIFTMICTFRLDYAVFNKGMTKFKDRRDEYTSSMQGLTSCLTICALCIYLVLQSQINQFTELPAFVTLLIFVELLLTPAISFWTLRKRYDFEYKPIVIVTLLMSVINPFLGVIAVTLTEEKGIARIISCILVQICFGLFFYGKNIIKGKKLCNLKMWKFAILFNIPLIPHYFSSYILDQSDRIMIQKFCGLESLALYSVAYNAGALMKIITSSISNALLPWQYKKLEEQRGEDVRKNITKIFIAVAICCIGFTLFAPEFMRILGGKKYMQAIYVIPPISASIFFIFVYGIFANVEFYYDANKFTATVSIFGAVLNLVLNYIFIPRYGYIAASYTSLASFVVFTFSHYIYMNNVVGKKTGQKFYPLTMIVTLSLGVIVGTLFIVLMYDLPVVRYIAILITALLAFWKRRELIGIIGLVKNK